VSTVLEAQGLSIGFAKQEVLRDVNLRVSEGDYWFLLGPNGCGKTSFLRTLLGELVPRSGALILDRERTRRDRIGFVPQRSNVSSTLPTTVREFVSLGSVGIPMTARQRGERLRWALERVNLSGFERRSFDALSGGQRQRALVARALVRRPAFLIADEPTVGLDLPSTEALLDSLSHLNREDGLTILFVTHHLRLARRFGTHFALFDHGLVVAGSADKVLSAENLARAYDLPLEVFQNDSFESQGGLGEGSGP